DPLAHLTKAVRGEAPGLLVGDLADGRPCPVCGSVHHPAPTAHGDVDALKRAFERFGDAAEQRAGLQERRRKLLQETEELRAARGWNDATPDRQALEAARDEATTRSTKLTAAKLRLQAIDGA